jgi:hypothetical protein
MFGFSSAFAMCKLQKGVLVRVTNVLLIPQYPPEHCDQLLPMALHRRQYPPLTFIYSLTDGKIQQKLVTDSLTSHNRPF